MPKSTPFGLEGAVGVAGKRDKARQISRRHAHSSQGVGSSCGEETNDHLASIYEGPSDQFASVVPFIKHGLEQGERCLYVADDNTEEEIIEALREGGIDVGAALKTGALSIYTKDETYLREGEFDTDRMLQFWQETLADAQDNKGFAGVRAAAEMTWALGEDSFEQDTGLGELARYEALLNNLYEGEDYVVLCQYNRERFPPDVLSDVIQSHPLVVYDGTVCKNFYYHPPEEFFGAERPPLDVGRTVEGLVSRAQTRQELQRREWYQRKLYEITSSPDRSFEEKLQDLFELGHEYFGLEIGGIARVDSETDLFEVERMSSTHSHLIPGKQYPLSETYCQLPEGKEGVAAVSDPIGRGFEGKLCYEKFGVKAYLGTWIELEEGLDRTFFFLSCEPREEPFSEAERTFLRLMGQWIEQKLKRKGARQALKESKDQLASKVEDLERLHALSTHLLEEENVEDALREVMTASAELLGAGKASVQVYDAKEEVLRLVGTLGFDQTFFEKFEVVRPEDFTTCAATLERGEPLLAEDLPRSSKFEKFARATEPYGIEAALSTPLYGSSGQLFGVFTMYWEKPHRPSEEKLKLLDLYTQQAARQIERTRSAEKLRVLNETLEERVKARTRQVRKLTSRVTLAEQRERDRIARLLHDSLQQRLYGSQIKISSLRKKAQEEGQEELARQTGHVEGEIEEITKALRRLSVEMSPPVLEREGLTAALEWLQSHMEETCGLNVELRAEREFQVEEEMRVLLFQTTRELLSVVAECSEASPATIQLMEEEGDLVIELIGEKGGVDPEVLERPEKGNPEKGYPGQGVGLRAACERIRLFGGELKLNSAGREARVEVRMPLDEAPRTWLEGTSLAGASRDSFAGNGASQH